MAEFSRLKRKNILVMFLLLMYLLKVNILMCWNF